MLFRILLIFCPFLTLLQLNAQSTRTIDGSSNNLLNQDWGSAGAELGTISSNGFTDGMNLPGGTTRPNPRVISNALFAQTELLNDPMNLSDFVWVFGQFLDHDLTAVGNSPIETANIPVNFSDVHFNPGNAHNNVMIRMNRSMPRAGSGNSVNNPRKFTNNPYSLDFIPFLSANTIDFAMNSPSQIQLGTTNNYINTPEKWLVDTYSLSPITNGSQRSVYICRLIKDIIIRFTPMRLMFFLPQLFD